MFCDLTCKYSQFPKKLCDGSMSCRTFVALYCTKKKSIVEKNLMCKNYKERKK